MINNTVWTNRITNRLIKTWAQPVCMLLLAIWFSGCLGEGGAGIRPVAPKGAPFIKLRVQTVTGEDLLNPQNPHAITMDSIAISYVGLSVRVDRPSEAAEIYLSEDGVHYALRLYVSLKALPSESTTVIKFGISDVRHVIKARLKWSSGNCSLTDYSVNGVDAGGPENTFVLVKPD